MVQDSSDQSSINLLCHTHRTQPSFGLLSLGSSLVCCEFASFAVLIDRGVPSSIASAAADGDFKR